MIVEAAIELTVPDNTAYTVLVALRGLGYPELARVERADIIRLFLNDGAGVDETVAALMRAEVVFNPNKHRISYARINSRDHDDNAAGEWEATVADRDDVTESLVKLLTAHFGLRELQKLERAVAWRLYETDGPASKERLEWACRELLCNPYSQMAAIRPRPLRRAVGEQTPAAANPDPR